MEWSIVHGRVGGRQLEDAGAAGHQFAAHEVDLRWRPDHGERQRLRGGHVALLVECGDAQDEDAVVAVTVRDAGHGAVAPVHPHLGEIAVGIGGCHVQQHSGAFHEWPDRRRHHDLWRGAGIHGRHRAVDDSTDDDDPLHVTALGPLRHTHHSARGTEDHAGLGGPQALQHVDRIEVATERQRLDLASRVASVRRSAPYVGIRGQPEDAERLPGQHRRSTRQLGREPEFNEPGLLARSVPTLEERLLVGAQWHRCGTGHGLDDPSIVGWWRRRNLLGRDHHRHRGPNLDELRVAVVDVDGHGVDAGVERRQGEMRDAGPDAEPLAVLGAGVVEEHGDGGTVTGLHGDDRRDRPHRGQHVDHRETLGHPVEATSAVGHPQRDRPDAIVQAGHEHGVPVAATEAPVPGGEIAVGIGGAVEETDGVALVQHPVGLGGHLECSNGRRLARTRR